MQFDEVLHLAARAVHRLIEILRAAVVRGDNVANVEPLRGRIQARQGTALALPALGTLESF